MLSGRTNGVLELGRNYTRDASRLQRDLLADYQRSVPPSARRRDAQFAAGTDVELQIRFFRLKEVRAAEGMLEVKVWWRSAWYDDRLRWDPANYGGVTEVQFLAPHANDENAMIWLPDIQPYNAIDGLGGSLDPANAKVQSDGRVFWSRPGVLQLMCRFSGLVAFPFDTLGCPIEVGGWMLSGAYQGLLAAENGGCAALADQEEVALASYTEYDLVRVECSRHVYTYDEFSNQPWPVLKYRLYVRRSSYYYVLNMLVPSVLCAHAASGLSNTRVTPPPASERVARLLCVQSSYSAF